jgi:glycine/D-amino acid oxidase-like deaminating enzyme
VRTFDTLVIGGGLVGSAIAYGVARHGGSVALIDEGDAAVRASRGNFALVWVQGKGEGMPRYAAWTRRSAELWSDFASELQERTGIDVAYENRGGIWFCFDDEEMAERQAMLARLKANAEPPGFEFEMVDRNAMAEMLPGLGQDLPGGSYCPHDGHCSSLHLFRALHAAFIDLGGRYLPEHRVTDIRATADSFTVITDQGEVQGGRLVLAAGHANAWLAPKVGLSVPVKPERGQVLVTERFEPLIPLPTSHVRQSREGTIMIGDSHEDVEFDDRSTVQAMAQLADQARRIFPFLARARIVRAWGCLRILPPDGFAIYDRSPDHPNAYTVSCHSGVTLAAVHAEILAGWICDGDLPDEIACFSAKRFARAEAA